MAFRTEADTTESPNGHPHSLTMENPASPHYQVRINAITASTILVDDGERLRFTPQHEAQ